MRLRYPELAPEGYAALSGFGHYVNTGTALEPVLLGLVNLRASILNGCTFCTQTHAAELRKLHEPVGRIDGVADWESSDAFTPRERAALRWTDVLTRLSSTEGASNSEFAAVSRFFRERELVDLTFAIASINAWNRMGVAFRPGWHPEQAAGADRAPASAPEAGEAAPERDVLNDDGGKVAED